MKTQEQINTEVKNYLNKATKHLFLINGVEHKILIEGDFIIRITGKDVSVSEISKKIGWYGSNSKCVIKHDLFLIPRYPNKEIITIKNYKAAKELYNKISESIKGKEDANEIKNIVKGLI